MKIRIRKTDRGYYVERFSGLHWVSWLTNRQCDREGYYDAFYDSIEDAKQAAIIAKREMDEKENGIVMEI